MKRFNIVFATIVSLLIILFVTTNIFLISANNNSSKEYKVEISRASIIFILNISLGIVSVIAIGIMLYIKYRILKPFNILSNLPLELSKGNLSANIKEHSSKYFGKFTWGLDLLREKLEEQKKKELEFQKEKKTNVMTLSHDIKTPLSVIELYAKALQKNLYKDEAKQKEATFNIHLSRKMVICF